ncbi:MAG: hypothetical protein KAT43_03925 [Nanoarchaeota archaeon]|nr:hypothetical protein [Nanoarchaeota archaeon]
MTEKAENIDTQSAFRNRMQIREKKESVPKPIKERHNLGAFSKRGPRKMIGYATIRDYISNHPVRTWTAGILLTAALSFGGGMVYGVKNAESLRDDYRQGVVATKNYVDGFFGNLDSTVELEEVPTITQEETPATDYKQPLEKKAAGKTEEQKKDEKRPLEEELAEPGYIPENEKGVTADEPADNF